MLLSLLVACGTEEGPNPDREPPPPAVFRFERTGGVENPGTGATALAEGPGAWIWRDGGFERIEGEGTVVERLDVALPAGQLLDRDAARWLVASDGAVAVLDAGGLPLSSHPEAGTVLAGRLTVSGSAWLVDRGDACELVEVDATGAPASVAAPCDLDGDLDAWKGGDEVRVAVDPVTGRTFAVEPGGTTIAVAEGNTVLDPVQIVRPARDLTARGGHLVVLSDAQVMMQVDIASGRTIAELELHQPRDIERIRLSDDGLGILLDSAEGLVFYRLDPEGRGYLLPGTPSWGSQPGSSGGSGNPPGGGRAREQGDTRPG
ncbi:MAG: hypothetical protein H6737_28060 [Alphaproteobacteria bacterium]|nr:hypothetical protein [Alphaproteobacteria bacterium]